MRSDARDHPHARRRRARGAGVFILFLVALLCSAFFRVQVLRSSTWMLRADSNRLRPLPTPAARGTVFDRNGLVVADNVPGYSVSLLPAPHDSIRASLERLQPWLGLSDARVARLLANARRWPREPLLVDVYADFAAVSRLEEQRHLFPGVYIEMRPRRRYVAGPATAHLIGFVGEVTAQELESERFAGYEQGMIVGKDGVERQYEERLQGEPGLRLVEVDARGRIVGSFVGRSETPAVPGTDIHLTIDVDLMEWIHRIFPEGMRGAVVALDAQDGGILALYSAPTYDPNDFVGGIDAELWNALNTDPARPLYNRAVLGLYGPASTWKLATAAIALDLGVVDPTAYMPQACRGGIQLGNRWFRCWRPEGHGHLDLADAIRHSCNVYFYQLGLRIGLDRLLEGGSRLGFARKCGVDLPQESSGIFPESRAFWERRFGYRPTEMEVASLSIGQGPISQTPLKMAQFYLALARDGSAPAPRLFRDTEDVDEAWSLDIAPENLEWLREGLRRVFAPGGTAYMSSLEHWDLIGKTGTGQNPHDPGRPHAWFAGMAGTPGGPPEIVVVALVEFGMSGSAAAAPLGAKTADFYLRKKYGIPADTVQTLREHLLTGRPAPWAWRRQ